jgi:hypothetical protein
MLLLSIKTPVNAHIKLTELPPKKSGMPGRVYVKISPFVYSFEKTIGRKTSSRMFRDSMY